jgi:hypothetical protein
LVVPFIPPTEGMRERLRTLTENLDRGTLQHGVSTTLRRCQRCGHED